MERSDENGAFDASDFRVAVALQADGIRGLPGRVERVPSIAPSGEKGPFRAVEAMSQRCRGGAKIAPRGVGKRFAAARIVRCALTFSLLA
jgi:hypothetical protein